MGELAPVAVGLAVGIAFVLLFSTSLDQAQTYPIDSSSGEPKPGQFREAAIKIALQNSTFQGV